MCAVCIQEDGEELIVLVYFYYNSLPKGKIAMLRIHVGPSETIPKLGGGEGDPAVETENSNLPPPVLHM